VLRLTGEFYAEYDFLHMLFLLCVGMFGTVLLLCVIIPDHMNTNLTWYMTMLTLGMYITNMCKGTFLLGYCGKLTDEAKVQLLAAVKSFVIIFALLAYTEGEISSAGLNIDLVEAHDNCVARVNKVYMLSGSQLSIHHNCTFAVVALLCSLVTFILTKPSINFSYFFFSTLRDISRDPNADYAD